MASNGSDLRILKMGHKPGVHGLYDEAGKLVRVIEGEPAEVTPPPREPRQVNVRRILAAVAALAALAAMTIVEVRRG
jgi:hypothetical protein